MKPPDPPTFAPTIYRISGFFSMGCVGLAMFLGLYMVWFDDKHYEIVNKLWGTLGIFFSSSLFIMAIASVRPRVLLPEGHKASPIDSASENDAEPKKRIIEQDENTKPDHAPS